MTEEVDGVCVCECTSAQPQPVKQGRSPTPTGLQLRMNRDGGDGDGGVGSPGDEAMAKYRAFSLYCRAWYEVLAGGAKTDGTTSNHGGLTTPTGLIYFLKPLVRKQNIIKCKQMQQTTVVWFPPCQNSKNHLDQKF